MFPFSRDEKSRVRFMFNTIAPVYSWFDEGVRNNFEKGFRLLQEKVTVTGMTVLDIGCGTGAWAYHFMKSGAHVTGVDISDGMLRYARNRYSEKMECIYEDILDEQSTIAGKKFDIVTASYVLHGMKRPERMAMLKRMKSLARKAVVIHDYGPDFAGVIMYLLEKAERSDYCVFRREFPKEFGSTFSQTSILHPRKSNAVYYALLD